MCIRDRIEIPEEKIAKFQMGSIRSKPEEYKKLSDFIENMEGAVPEKDQKKACLLYTSSYGN